MLADHVGFIFEALLEAILQLMAKKHYHGWGFTSVARGATSDVPLDWVRVQVDVRDRQYMVDWILAELQWVVARHLQLRVARVLLVAGA